MPEPTREAIDSFIARWNSSGGHERGAGHQFLLEKLRRGEALTDKERKIHDHGLVTILKQIHDDLDAAVLEAYGWQDLMESPHSCGDLPPGEGAPDANDVSCSPHAPLRQKCRNSLADRLVMESPHFCGDLPPGEEAPDASDVSCSPHAPLRQKCRNSLADCLAAGGPDAEALEQELLTRLVALNHERAAEEKRGLIRWLRPDYQAPESITTPQPTQQAIALSEGESASSPSTLNSQPSTLNHPLARQPRRAGRRRSQVPAHHRPGSRRAHQPFRQTQQCPHLPNFRHPRNPHRTREVVRRANH